MEGCTIPGAQGDFDFAVHLRGDSLARVDIQTVVHNRLDVGLGAACVVLRFPAVIVPPSADTYALFGPDEWVSDPVTNLGAQSVVRDDPYNGLFYWGFDAGHGFYRQFQNGRPVLSVHRPGWGMMLHDLEPDNSSAGYLMIGSNDGALEVAYYYRILGELRPQNGTNGPMILSPGLRMSLLPGVRPANTAWWETVDAYRAFALEEGLLKDTPLARRKVPSRWAQDAVYTVFNLGANTDGNVPGAKKPAVALVDPWIKYMEKMILFYGACGQTRFCPLLWGWSAIGPYAPIPGVDDILTRFNELERKYGVEIHPGIYILPNCMGTAAIGTPLEQAYYHNLRGEPHRWGPKDDLINVEPSNPLFIRDIEDAIQRMLDKGIEWVYFDNPYVNPIADPRYGGILEGQGAAIRHLIERAKSMLEKHGGGFIACERYRLGLDTSYGVNHEGVLPGSENVPFTEALVHDLHITGSFGDLSGIGWQMIAADPAYGFGGDVPGAAQQVHRLGVEGAAYGRVCIDGNQGADLGFFEFGSRPEAHYRALGEMYETSVRNGLRARLKSDALRTGRMLPPPPCDGGQVTIARKRPLAEGGMSHTVKAVAERFPAGFFASVECAPSHTLAVANPEPVAARVAFRIRPAEYPTMAAHKYWRVRGGTDAERVIAADTEAVIAIEVPAHDVALVTFYPAQLEDDSTERRASS
jgi:hypothetical protein